MVLERPNSGLVLTVNARFFTSIEPLKNKEPDHPNLIEVISPQFHRKEIYKLQFPDFALIPLYVMNWYFPH